MTRTKLAAPKAILGRAITIFGASMHTGTLEGGRWKVKKGLRAAGLDASDTQFGRQR